VPVCLEFDMTKRRDLKALVRARMDKTGERYATALRHLAHLVGAPRGAQAEGWHVEGSTDGVELTPGGDDSVSLRSTRAGTVATALRQVSAEAWAGRRVRLRAKVKASRVQGWCSLFVEQTRQVTPLWASWGWVTAEVVVDVAPGVEQLSFGVRLGGTGEVGVEALELGLAPEAVTTEQQRQRHQAQVDEWVADALVRVGLGSKANARAALTRAAEASLSLESVLGLDASSQAALRQALATQFGVRAVSARSFTVAPAVVSLVPRELATRERVLPLDLHDGVEGLPPVLVLATTDPTNAWVLAELAVRTGCAVEPVLALQDELRLATDSAWAAVLAALPN
jgi:hypothetical protein